MKHVSRKLTADDLINRYVYIFYYKGDMNYDEI